MYINYKEGDGGGGGGAIIWHFYLFIDCPKTWWCDVPNKVVQNLFRPFTHLNCTKFYEFKKLYCQFEEMRKTIKNHQEDASMVKVLS